MSINNSYFNRNNTLIFNSTINTGRNPVTELTYGFAENLISTKGYSRFIFNIDLSLLMSKIDDGTISTDCSSLTHKLHMTNTSKFDEELLNQINTSGRRRATSFDLILFRIPNSQQWDEGVGYDYTNPKKALNTTYSVLTYGGSVMDQTLSDRPSNWFLRNTTSGWTTSGIYNNLNTSTGSGVNYSALTIVDI